MAILYASRSKEIAEKYLLEANGSFLSKTAQAINDASAKGLFKVTVCFGSEMNTDSKTWLVRKLNEYQYKVEARYFSQYNEHSYNFEISWGAV